MSNIYPFRAITPLSGLEEYNIQNRFIYCNEKGFDHIKEFYEKKLIYINDLLKQGMLHNHEKESFYCCKISNSDFSVIGLIALVNINLVNKTILRHERCIGIKEEAYLEYFKKYKIQISPIILMHKDNLLINKNLNYISNKSLPFLTINDNEYKYEIWTINDLSLYKELYNTVDSFLIADGHHRLASMNLLGHNKFITAFLTSVSYIKSADIYREYNNVDSLSKKKLQLFLNNNFELVKIINAKNLSNDGFLFKIDSTIYLVKDSNNDHTRRNILEFLDKSINYKNDKLNFYNYLYNENNNLHFNDRNSVAVLIPALGIIINGKRSFLPYPPHSTLFYPKLPDGLIINKY